jgi:hypothetical protein
MAWTWRYEAADGSAVRPDGFVDAGGAPETFPSQADAETFIGESWRELLAAGVHQVTLLDGDREVYGPMGLTTPE